MTKAKDVKYNKKLTDELCERMSNGESVSSICHDKHMPSKGAVTQWKDKYESFAKQYTHAHETRQEYLFSQILDIADNPDEDVNRSRLRVDARKWQLSKMNPKLYGDKTQLTDADGDGPIKIETITRTIIDPKKS